MPLSKKEEKQILDLVRKEPVTIQAVANTIDKNWRTADKYVKKISRQTGLIDLKVFREGTRGALKIVYWNALEPERNDSYQQRLFETIKNSKRKQDFSPLSIYQFVADDEREAYKEEEEHPEDSPIYFSTVFQEAEETIKIFSGNLSWASENEDMIRCLKDRAEDGISVKILSRVDLTNQDVVEELLVKNATLKKDMIEIKHCEMPVRGVLVDDELVLKEVYTEELYPEMDKDYYTWYRIKEGYWTRWMERVFWHFWETSVDAKKRLDAIKTVS